MGKNYVLVIPGRAIPPDIFTTVRNRLEAPVGKNLGGMALITCFLH